MTSRALLLNGLRDQNPGFVQLLGLCPLLAVSTSVANALGLGLATLAGIAVLAWSAVRELAGRAKGRVAVHQLDPHSAFIPELGLTMADGGEKVDEDEEKAKEQEK